MRLACSLLHLIAIISFLFKIFLNCSGQSLVPTLFYERINNMFNCTTPRKPGKYWLAHILNRELSCLHYLSFICSCTVWMYCSRFSTIFGSTVYNRATVYKWRNFLKVVFGGRVMRRSRVYYVTGASNWHWLTVGHGLLSLQQVSVEVECFYFFSFFTFIPVHLSSLSLSFLGRRWNRFGLLI